LDRPGEALLGPAELCRDRARCIAAHHDQLDTVSGEPREVRRQQAVQVGIGAFTVRHVRLIGEVDDVVTDPGRAQRGEHGKAAESRVVNADH
jgi:hypothetical protein